MFIFSIIFGAFMYLFIWFRKLLWFSILCRFNQWKYDYYRCTLPEMKTLLVTLRLSHNITVYLVHLLFEENWGSEKIKQSRSWNTNICAPVTRSAWFYRSICMLKWKENQHDNDQAHISWIMCNGCGKSILKLCWKMRKWMWKLI